MTDIKIREVESVDVQQGLLETLGELADVDVNVLKAAMLVCEQRYVSAGRMFPKKFTFVAQKCGHIVGTASLLIERKLIHAGGLVGHIEDVAVYHLCQGNGIGKKLMNRCIEFARELGCYKVILNCAQDNVPFYAGLGFRPHEVGMRLDLNSGGGVDGVQQLQENTECRDVR